MRLQNWFIRNLDDYQRQVIIESIDKSVIVQGVAGSGKTNLAIHRALQAKGKGSYAIIVMTVALRRMIAYGMEQLGLDKERIAYEWAWTHRGFDLEGDVYCKLNAEGRIISDTLYLVTASQVRKFLKTNQDIPERYTVDFGDWVEDRYYRAWGRRTSRFYDAGTCYFDINSRDSQLIPSAVISRKSDRDKKVDYLIVDEAQDFNVQQYREKIVPLMGKSLSLLGDSNQQMTTTGSSIQAIKEAFSGFKLFNLVYNYRLPKSIGKVAQTIQSTQIDLLSHNLKNGGNSDYPHFPKPQIIKCSSKEKELELIVSKIQMEDLDDVAIFVNSDSQVAEINNFLNQRGIQTQVHYRTKKTVPFNTINTLDFSNNDLPCILEFMACKGSEFDNVFIPFADQSLSCSAKAFFVACTRSSHSLYITYTGKLTQHLSRVDENDVVKSEIN